MPWCSALVCFRYSEYFSLYEKIFSRTLGGRNKGIGGLSPVLSIVVGLTAEVVLVVSSSFVKTFFLSSRENINYF